MVPRRWGKKQTLLSELKSVYCLTPPIPSCCGWVIDAYIVKLFPCMIESHIDSGGISPVVSNPGTRWRPVGSFTPQPLYPQGNGPRYPLIGGLGWSQCRSGCFGEEKKLLNLRGIELRFLGLPDRSVFTIPTTLSQLSLLRRMVPKCYQIHLVSRLIQLYNIVDLLAILCRQRKSQRAQHVLYTIQCIK